MRIFSLVVLACCAAFASRAEVRPKVLPDRDVSVTYRSGTTTDQVSYSASKGVFRRAHDGQPGFMLVNTRDGTMHLVDDKHHAVVLVQGGLFGGPFPWDKGMRFRRVGQDTVAGLACTEWEITMAVRSGAPPEQPGRICLTADGVILRYGDAESGEAATMVVYGGQDVAGFRVPAGYRGLSLAEAMRLE